MWNWRQVVWGRLPGDCQAAACCCKHSSGPIDNRPQLTKLPHKRAAQIQAAEPHKCGRVSSLFGSRSRPRPGNSPEARHSAGSMIVVSDTSASNYLLLTAWAQAPSAWVQIGVGSDRRGSAPVPSSIPGGRAGGGSGIPAPSCGAVRRCSRCGNMELADRKRAGHSGICREVRGCGRFAGTLAESGARCGVEVGRGHSGDAAGCGSGWG